MSQIEISCIGQTAIFTNTPEIFSGDIGVDTVKFTFDGLWDGYTIKTAVFYNNPKETYTVILDENNVAVIPENVMYDKCKLSIGVFGTNANGDVKTSKILTYHIGKGAISNDLESTTTTPDLWTQILLRQTKVEADVETIESIAKGCNKALAYNSYVEMIETLNAMGSDELIRGQNIYIGTVGVPDLWVYSVETENVEYTYVDDLTFVETMDANITVQVGHYKLAQLETQEVDIVGLETDYNSVKGEVDLLKGTIGYTKKNLLVYPYHYGTRSINGLNYTDNGDGTITVNGKCTAIDTYIIKSRTENPITLKAGKYTFNGCPQGGSNATYYLRLTKTNKQSGNADDLGYDYGDGCTFIIEEDSEIGIFLLINTDVTVNNLTFKPMIRPASIEDDTFEKYVPSLSEGIKKWIPNATNFTADRCYYLKSKDKLDIWFSINLATEINESTKTAIICNDIKSTFSVNNIVFTTNLLYSNNYANPVCIANTNNQLQVQYNGKSVPTSNFVYGQISIPIY